MERWNKFTYIYWDYNVCIYVHSMGRYIASWESLPSLRDSLWGNPKLQCFICGCASIVCVSWTVFVFFVGCLEGSLLDWMPNAQYNMVWMYYGVLLINLDSRFPPKHIEALRFGGCIHMVGSAKGFLAMSMCGGTDTYSVRYSLEQTIPQTILYV